MKDVETTAVNTELGVDDEVVSDVNIETAYTVDAVEDDIGEVDESDLELESLYVQEGIYVNVELGVANIEESVLEQVVNEQGYFEYDTGEVARNGKKVIKKLKVKKYRKKKRKPFDLGRLKSDTFGPMQPFLDDINVTDINWNGQQLWIDDVTKGRYLSDVVLSNDFVEVFTIRISNVVSRQFNKYTPRLEAETEDVRVTVLHESVSNTGRAISIRKTPAVKRINFFDSIKNGEYCTEETANIMSNSVKAKLNIVVCGLPGVGKTELVKFLTNYIRPFDRVITVEDTLELRYNKINPGKDCLELKVSPQLTYVDAIKASLRLLPQWVILSEARSTEVRYLIESVSTGTKCLTTIHADDVRKIPDRVVNMIGDINQAEIIRDSVYTFFNMGILIDKKVDEKTGKITRWISQVGLFDRSNGVNSCTLLVDEGKTVKGAKIPDEIMRKYKTVGIDNPYEYKFIE